MIIWKNTYMIDKSSSFEMICAKWLLFKKKSEQCFHDLMKLAYC